MSSAKGSFSGLKFYIKEIKAETRRLMKKYGKEKAEKIIQYIHETRPLERKNVLNRMREY